LIRPATDPRSFPDQAGGGLLTVIAAIGVILLMAQGTSYYRARGSAKFLGSEKNKVLAMQMAEAGVEENIADIGRRRTRVYTDMPETVTYNHEPLASGSYSSLLRVVATGPAADTVDLVSTGSVGVGSATVIARMRLKKFIDTSRTIAVYSAPETTYTVTTHPKPDTAATTTVADPNAMPAVNTTPAYTACMSSSSKKCDICHLPGGDVTKANVINVSKSSIGTHVSHHGDYVTTDGTCDLYKPHTVLTITYHMVSDSTRHIADHTTYDTSIVIDTAVKVQILSWK
jgi:hypothetical protein